jgi:hypothetical protein
MHSKNDIDLIFESYNQHVLEESVLSFFKDFSKKLFSATKDKYAGFDDELIEELSERLRKSGPEGLEAFLQTLKKEGGKEFEGALSGGIRKIAKAMRFGFDSGIDAVTDIIYDVIAGGEENTQRFSQYRLAQAGIPEVDPDTGARLTASERSRLFRQRHGENEETDSDKDLKPGDHIDKIVDNYKTYQLVKDPRAKNNAALNIRDHSEALIKWVDTASLSW